jgi:hypothetical protein
MAQVPPIAIAGLTPTCVNQFGEITERRLMLVIVIRGQPCSQAL